MKTRATALLAITLLLSACSPRDEATPIGTIYGESSQAASPAPQSTPIAAPSAASTVTAAPVASTGGSFWASFGGSLLGSMLGNAISTPSRAPAPQTSQPAWQPRPSFGAAPKREGLFGNTMKTAKKISGGFRSRR